MVIHYSILAIILFVSFFWNRTLVQNKRINPDYKMALTPWLLVFGYLAFLAAMRTKMNDTYTYMHGFQLYEGTLDAAINCWKDGDIRYDFTNFLGNVFKAYVSDDYHVWFALFSVIESICFIYVYRRECNDVLIPMFYFFASNLYYNYFTMLRQFIAVAICFASLELFKEKKWIRYALCCALAILFHPSAMYAVVFMFLSTGQPWKKKQAFISIVFTLGILFANPIIESMSDSDDSVYGYAIAKMTTNTGSSPLRAAVAIIPVLLAFIYRRQIEEENNFVLNLSVNMAVFELGLTLVATFTSGLYVIRLATYLAPYACILYSYLFTKIVRKEISTIILPVFFIMFMAYYILLKQHSGDGYYISDVLNIDTTGYGFDVRR